MAESGSLSNIIAALPVTPAGGVMKGTSASVLPTSAVSVLDSTFVPLGLVTEDGVQITPNVSTSTEKAWGGQPVKVLTTESSVEVSVSFFEILNATLLKAAYGANNVLVTPATSDHGEQIKLAFRGELPPAAPYVIDARDGNARIRVVFPALQITEQGEIILNSAETTKPTLAATAYPDADGVLMYIHTDDGVTTEDEDED